jgi:pyruvate dehydrogenase E2 component (dihydrolipoamide acetyltransferase)
MASDVTMPRLSDSMEEGTILKWLVEVGSEVKRGEPLVEVETDKANMTYDADTDGVLVEVVASEGDTLAVGEVIARIGDASEVGDGGKKAEERPEAEDRPEAEQLREGEEREEAEGEKEAAAAGGGRGGGGDGGASGGGEAEAEQAAAGARGGDGGAAGRGGDGAGAATRERAPAAPTNGDGGRVKASPVARRMARELGVELARLEGTGPGGRIVKADVEQAAKDGSARVEEAPAPEEAPPERAREPAPAGAKGEPEVVDLTRLQQTVSRRMAESKATAPDFALEIDVDMTKAVELRQRLKEISDPAPSFNDMVVKAAALALREHPRVNGAYRDGKFELYPQINVGVAVAAQDALVVPVIAGADQKSLGEISRAARGLIEKVREGSITPPELSGGTFTVSNLGMFGIDRFTAIINPPQAAILTVGALAKRPAVDDSGRIVARDQMTLTLVCDHRILYGADGAQFLARVKELLEQPLALAL